MQAEIEEAVRDVRAGRAERICAPGQWRVWREGNDVMSEVITR